MNRIYKNNRIPIPPITWVTGSVMKILYSIIFMCILTGSVAAQDFDLALSIFPTEDMPVNPGDVANFTIQVHNQGEVDAQNVKVVDYIPAGLEFVALGNGDWSSLGNKAITTITDVIQAGEVYEISINLRLRSYANPSNIYNYAEIAFAQDTNGNDLSEDDIDSTADTDNSNDQGAGAFSNTDGSINLPNFIDEDDHDVALLIICTQNACNNYVNISLNAACDIEILADMILENPAYPNGAYTVVLEDEFGNTLPDNTVNGTYVGRTIKVTTFIEGCESDACWGYATIEDKFAINLFCQVDTVDCGEEDVQSIGFPLAPGTNVIDLGDEFIVQGLNGCSDIILTYEDTTTELPCQNGSPYILRIDRVFTAIDGVGNTATCTSEIFIRKGNISDVEGPDDYVTNPLACGEYPTLDNGNPDPEFTGFPSGTTCPNIIVVFDDLEIPSSVCPGTFDIRREFTVIDWCTGQDTTIYQLIKIMDLQDPVCNIPDEFYGSTYPDLCIGSIDVVPPIVTDNCSETSYTIAYKPLEPGNNNYNNLITDGIAENDGNFSIFHLEVGEYRIAYFITDACGNTTQCLGRFEIRDLQEPTPVCILQESVTLDGFGNASLDAEVFDAGSFDNCGDVTFTVARMNNDCGFGGTSFKSFVNFCCEDAGKEVMVVLRVTDEYGNQNDCMIMVTVHDDIVPTIQCPSDLTISCLQYDQYPNGVVPTNITGSPLSNDNCDVEIDYFDTQAFNNCGVGIIVRTWSAIDGSGNLASCKQYIEVESDFEFSSNMIDWPADTEVNQCLNDVIDPDVTGFPVLPNNVCADLSVSFNDIIAQNNGSGCGVVERTFTVTDNCALDPNNNSFSYVQEIEVYENIAPVFIECQAFVEFEANNSTCSGNINYPVYATDNCTADNALQYSYSVDIFNNGSIDGSYNGNFLTGEYPSGTHRAVFTVVDECNNESQCSLLFTVRETKNPTPICKPISISLGSDGIAEVWASDFNHKSFDNCTDEEDLIYTFSTDLSDLVNVYDCNDLINGVTGVITLEMYVHDQAGNYDYCTVNLTITDSDDVCEDAGTLTADLSGKVMTMKDHEDFGNVEVMAKGSVMNEKFEMTDISGDYTFSALSLYDNYTLRPLKNDDALNGITTLDIVKIQKHILGLNILTKMESLIAADVDHDENISGIDIIQLRKLLLGKYENDELPNNNSWRFVPSNFQWNSAFPFEIDEEIILNNVLESQSSLEFYGIKVGDVHASAKVNLQGNNVITRSQPVNFYLDNQNLIADEIIDIPVYISESYNLQGFQVSFEVDGNMMELIEVNSPVLNISEGNYSIRDNRVYISWSNSKYEAFNENDILMTLKIKSKQDARIKTGDFVVNSDFHTEIFDENEEWRNIEIDIRNEEENIKPTQLLQNFPNPFSNDTYVEFEMENSSELYIQLFDVNGKMIMNKVENYEKGNHRMLMTSDVFPSSGIYYLNMETNKWTSTIKLIKL